MDRVKEIYMTKFKVPDMSCAHCTKAIEMEIKSTDPSAEITCDLTDRTVAVESTLGNDAVLAAIKEAGYDANSLL